MTNPLIKCEAIAEAGKSLKNLGNSALALKEYRQGLKIESGNLEFRREEAFHLSRLKQFDEAIVKWETLRLTCNPNDWGKCPKGIILTNATIAGRSTQP